MTVEELRQKRKNLYDQVSATRDAAASEERDMSQEEWQTVEIAGNEIAETEAEIKTAENRAELLARIEAGQERLSQPGPWWNDPARKALEQPVYEHGYEQTGKLMAYKKPEEAFAAGMWFKAAFLRDPEALEFCKGQPGEAFAALSTASNPKGGYLVPRVMSNVIIDLRETYGVYRRESDVVPMSSDAQTFPRRSGGVTAYAVTDNDEVTASDTEWNQVELIAKKWGALTRVASELWEDSAVSLGDWLTNEIAYAFSLKEDQSGFIGDGTSTYHGVAGVTVKINDGTHTASVFDAASGNTAFGTLDLEDFENLLGTVPEFAVDRGNAKWYISRAGFYASMSRIMNAVGGNTNANIASGAQMEFLGYPVVISQVMNKTLTAQASTVLCFFGDLRQAAMLGDRRDVRVKVDESRYLEYDQTAVLGTERVAINPHSLGDNTDAGPIVAMKTPSS